MREKWKYSRQIIKEKSKYQMGVYTFAVSCIILSFEIRNYIWVMSKKLYVYHMKAKIIFRHLRCYLTPSEREREKKVCIW